MILMLAAGSGAAGVALGAFGAHALKARLLAADSISTWDTAVHYHMLHAVVLLAIGLWSKINPDSTALSASGVLIFIGIVLFSGSLYGLALGGPRWLGPVTPLGGLAFIVGWLLLLGPALAISKGS